MKRSLRKSLRNVIIIHIQRTHVALSQSLLFLKRVVLEIINIVIKPITIIALRKRNAFLNLVHLARNQNHVTAIIHDHTILVTTTRRRNGAIRIIVMRNEIGLNQANHALHVLNLMNNIQEKQETINMRTIIDANNLIQAHVANNRYVKTANVRVDVNVVHGAMYVSKRNVRNTVKPSAGNVVDFINFDCNSLLKYYYINYIIIF